MYSKQSSQCLWIYLYLHHPFSTVHVAKLPLCLEGSGIPHVHPPVSHLNSISQESAEEFITAFMRTCLLFQGSVSQCPKTILGLFLLLLYQVYDALQANMKNNHLLICVDLVIRV